MTPLDPFVLRFPGGRTLDCRPAALATRGAYVMGILNVTPDSFSDGGRYTGLDAALARAQTMLDEGAAILDVGGESTRPRGSAYGAGAAAVGEEEERRRVVPVVAALARRFPGVLLSVDTYKPAVAAAALDAGAHLVNDVTGLRLFPAMAGVCARAGAPLVVMHSVGTPGEMPHVAPLADPVGTVVAGLRAGVAAAEAAGVPGVVVDAGFGFGKTAADNLALVAASGRIRDALGRPVLLGVSRKATIGALLGAPGAPVPVAQRLFGTLGVTAAGVRAGASLVRTHDVRETVELLRGMAAVQGTDAGRG